MTTTTLHLGNCLDVLKTMPDNSVDGIVTDPPYGLGDCSPANVTECLTAWVAGKEYQPKGGGFMGKKWDAWVPSPTIFKECLRVLKPGGHLLAFAGTRTQHLMATSIQLAGFELRDMIAWIYGSGFPKSLNIEKQIEDKACTLQWQGWGTALKPALEPITLARKPLIGTVAANVQAHGTGGINIDGCRIATDDDRTRLDGGYNDFGLILGVRNGYDFIGSTLGRWPANLIHDGSDEVTALFPNTQSSAGLKNPNGTIGFNGGAKGYEGFGGFDDSGSASRFFYCAKASKDDRDAGIAGIAGIAGCGMQSFEGGRDVRRRNTHPTVKPTDLMRYLVRLVTPPNGTVLDPFMGSGSTGIGAVLEGFDFIGIEMDAGYLEIARQRIEHAKLIKISGLEKLDLGTAACDKTASLFDELPA